MGWTCPQWLIAHVIGCALAIEPAASIPRAGVGTRDWLQAEGSPRDSERLDCMTDAMKLGEVGAVTHEPSDTAIKGKTPGRDSLGPRDGGASWLLR
jgi:hypothetical protein